MALDAFQELLTVARRSTLLTRNLGTSVAALMRLADFLSEPAPNAESIPLLDEAAASLDALSEKNCGALSLLIEINGKRIDLLRLFDPARAGDLAEKLENQKRLYEEMCAGD